MTLPAQGNVIVVKMCSIGLVIEKGSVLLPRVDSPATQPPWPMQRGGGGQLPTAVQLAVADPTNLRPAAHEYIA